MISALKFDTGGGGLRFGRIHRIATSAQAGVALSLIVTCSLFVRALGVMEQRDLGFDPQDLMLTRMDLAQQGYTTAEAGEAVLDRMKASVSTVPGVTSVTVAVCGAVCSMPTQTPSARTSTGYVSTPSSKPGALPSMGW